MTSFNLPDTAYRYRPLKLGLRGWDVYALQTALRVFGYHIMLDGVFGPITDSSVRLWQEGKQLTVDGIAGIVTQRSLALSVAQTSRKNYHLPLKLLMGQIEHESGFQLGNHTAVYTNGSRDLGVAQLNDLSKQLEWHQAFSVQFALDQLAAEIREKHDRYLEAPLRTDAKRVSNGDAWRLAAGSWNRPAHAAYLAGMRGNDPVAPASRSLTETQREWILGYMDRVCVYADAYYAERSWPE